MSAGLTVKGEATQARYIIHDFLPFVKTIFEISTDFFAQFSWASASAFLVSPCR